METYLAQIGIFAFATQPSGWLPCDGRLLPVAQYQALYSLLGITYGGDGRNTFGLPDLRGSLPVHRINTTMVDRIQAAMSPGYVEGGSETVSLTRDQVPGHTHTVIASGTTGTSGTPVAGVASVHAVANCYAPLPAANDVARIQLAPGSIQFAGGGVAHSNLQPYTVVRFMIAVSGLYPSRL